MNDKLDVARRLNYHQLFLREVARSTPVIEVVWPLDEVRRSLQFIVDQGQEADGRTAKAVAYIFSHTNDDDTRRLCIAGLYRINNSTAKKEMLALYRDETVASAWRLLIAEHLRSRLREDPRMNPRETRVIVSVIGQ